MHAVSDVGSRRKGRQIAANIVHTLVTAVQLDLSRPLELVRSGLDASHLIEDTAVPRGRRLADLQQPLHFLHGVYISFSARRGENGLQVVQHPAEPLPGRGTGQMFGRGMKLCAGRLQNSCEDFVFMKEPAAEEGIDVDRPPFPAVHLDFSQEVARRVDAMNRESNPLSDAATEQRQRDG